MQRPSSPLPPELVAFLAQRRRPPAPGWRTERPRYLPAALFEPPRVCVFLVDGKPVPPPAAPLYSQPERFLFRRTY